MISEEDKVRIREAKTCNKCKEWHKYCDAECCKLLYICKDPSELSNPGKYIQIKKVLTVDQRLYYKLHGVKILHGYIRFDKSKCIPYGDKIIFVNRCKWLNNNNECIEHSDKRPSVCRQLSKETAKDTSAYGFDVTPNCLFKYKNMREK